MRYLIPLVVFAVMVIFLGIGLTLNPREVPSPFIGKPAPTFNLPQVADANKTLSTDDLKGEVSLVNVWASWCTSCREEHPVLLQLAEQNIVPIYGLNYKDERDNALAWLQRLGDPYTASAFDPEGKTGIDWGVYGVPETFVIDRDGIIRHKQTGPVTPEILEKKLLPLIRQLQNKSS
ncbi:DsbE family thiol:disulfide interchange protein [Methylocaldum szegediense]|jgi:cytochrome c biogenesis protein CcmG/thiol:disulfide interchange protein DsbE|uniref:Thiol:disulfide oxidoreductase CcmG n=1 Tax=Methylocaldum szegediense TaxID=73780 RepID=A0ABM9I7Y4_9GAMM|nr:DsbE family thiol:disulfide interchange protein [Methylocaldum szegediense]CAI8948929.1 thiol:disulfide oxidoreductase CcmG [Methylocaldum szegediense]